MLLAAISELQPPAATSAIGVQETRWHGDVDELVDTAWGTIHLLTANDPIDAANGRNGIALVLTGVLARAKVTANRPSPRLLSTLIEPTGRGAPRLRIHVGYAPASNSAAEDPFTPWLDTLQRTIATAQSTAPWIPDLVLADLPD
jgi:hypothetical protein